MPEQRNNPTKGGLKRGANRGHMIIIPDVLIDIYVRIIGIYAFAVYCAIVRHYNRDTRRSYPGIDLMGRELRASPRQVKRVLKVLLAHRMIAAWKEGRHNVYRPLHFRHWRTNPSATGAQVAPVTVPDRPPNHIVLDDAPNTVLPGSPPGHMLQDAHIVHDDPTPPTQHNDDTAVPHGQGIGEPEQVPDRPPNHIVLDDAPNTVLPGNSLTGHILQGAHTQHDHPTPPTQHPDAPGPAVPHSQAISGPREQVPDRPPNQIEAQTTGHPDVAGPGGRTGATRGHQAYFRKLWRAKRGFGQPWVDDAAQYEFEREIEREIRLENNVNIVCEGYTLLADKWGREPEVDRAVVESRLEDGYTAGYLLNASVWWVQEINREDYSLGTLCAGSCNSTPNLTEFGRAVLDRIEQTLRLVIPSAKRPLSEQEQADVVGASLSDYGMYAIDTEALAAWLRYAPLRPPEEDLDDLRVFDAEKLMDRLRPV